MSDQETIHAFVAGDHAALEKIILSHTKALQAYCTAILCNKEDAKDAV